MRFCNIKKVEFGENNIIISQFVWFKYQMLEKEIKLNIVLELENVVGINFNGKHEH